MEIVVGKPIRVGTPTGHHKSSGIGAIEARVLGIRKPRKGSLKPHKRRTERRTQPNAADPVNGRVLTLMIQDGPNIPSDIDSGKYRVFVRFASK